MNLEVIKFPLGAPFVKYLTEKFDKYENVNIFVPGGYQKNYFLWHLSQSKVKFNKIFTFSTFQEDFSDMVDFRKFIKGERFLIIYKILKENPETKDKCSPFIAQAIYNLLNEIYENYPKDIEDFLEKIKNLLKDNKLRESLKENLIFLKNVLEIYKEKTKEIKDAKDKYLFAKEIAEKIDKKNLNLGKNIFVGFYDLTYPEIELLKSIIKNSERSWFLTYQECDKFLKEKLPEELQEKFQKANEENIKQKNGVVIKNFIDEDEEISWIIYDILKKKEKNPRKEMLIIVSNIYSYFPMIERVLKRFDFPESKYNIYFKGKINENPQFSILLLPLEIILKNFRNEYLFSLWRNSLVKLLSDIDIKEKLKLEWIARNKNKIIEGKENWEEFTREIENKNNQKVDKNTIEKFKEFLKILGNFQEEFSQKSKTFKQKVDILFKTIENELKIEFKSKEIKKFINELKFLANKYGDFEVNEEEFKSLIEYISNFYEEYNIWKPEVLNICGVIESKGINADYIYFAGLTYENFPRLPEAGFIPYKTRKEINLPDENKRWEQSEIDFKRIINSAIEQAYLTYPEGTDKEPKVKSVFLFDLERK